MGQIRKTGLWGAGKWGRNYLDHEQTKPDTEVRQSHVDGAAGQHTCHNHWSWAVRPLTPATWKDCKFKASLGYRVKTCLKMKNTKRAGERVQAVK